MKPSSTALILAMLLLAACGPEEGDTVPKPPTLRCNGAAGLCAKRFDQVSYPTTHNSMASEEWGWFAPNQKHGLARQLADGVRGLMLDTHLLQGKAWLCHGSCNLGRKELSEGLATVRKFIEGNRGTVVTIIFESYVAAAVTSKAFEASGLLAMTHAQQKGAPWPTLAEMVEAGRPVVVFTDREGGAYPWYHRVWDFSWSNHWAAKSTDDLKCDRHRGATDGGLYILNNFLTNPVASPGLAAKANSNPGLKERAQRCRRETGRLPNFVAVDYYEIGDLLGVVKELNGG